MRERRFCPVGGKRRQQKEHGDREAQLPADANADYQAVALRSLLEAELAAMEGRLIAHINAKLNEVLQEIRSSGRVPTTS